MDRITTGAPDTAAQRPRPSAPAAGSSVRPPSAGALAACLVAGFATLVDSGLVGIVTPALQQSLGAGTAATQWILSSYSLTFGLALVPAGRWGDRFGRRRLFLTGIALFALSAVISVSASVAWPVIIARLLQGVGAGIVSSQVLGVIQDLYTGPARARALGAYGVSSGLAAVVGPSLGAGLLALAGEQGWRLALLVCVPCAAAAFALGLRYLPHETSAGERTRSDPIGLVLLGVLTLALVLPVIWTRGPVVGILTVGALAAAAFLWWERRYTASGRTAILVPELLADGGYLRGTVVAMCWFGATLAHGTLVTLYLIVALGQSPLLAAVVMVPRAVLFVLSSSISWRLVGRWGRTTVTTGLSVQCVGVVTIAVVGGVSSSAVGFLVVLTVVEAIMGFAHGACEAPNRVLTLAAVPTRVAGVAAGFLQLTQRLSATVAVAAVTGIMLAGAPPASGSSTLVVASAVPAGLLAAAVAVSVLESRRSRRRAVVPDPIDVPLPEET